MRKKGINNFLPERALTENLDSRKKRKADKTFCPVSSKVEKVFFYFQNAILPQNVSSLKKQNVTLIPLKLTLRLGQR